MTFQPEFSESKCTPSAGQKKSELEGQSEGRVVLSHKVTLYTKLTDYFRSIKRVKRGFPGGAVVESLPAGAGDAGSSPGLGGSRIPHAAEQLGP